MRVVDRARVLAQLGRDAVADRGQVVTREVQRVPERLDLLVEIAGLELGLAHGELLGLEPEHGPDRHAGRGRDAGERHGSPPNFPSTNSCNATSASPSSAPRALTVIVAPSSAASIITPMMLLPFTSRPSRDTMTSDLKRDAVFTNRAQARACSPSWLRIRSWISATDPPCSGMETPGQDQSDEPERE